MLPALHFVKGTQVRVGIAEIDDEAERHLIVLEVIKETTAAGSGETTQWPT